jgi:hypothetical protein
MTLSGKLKALFAPGKPPVVPDEDPLDYDQVVPLDAEDLAEQGMLTAYQALLPRLRQYVASPVELTEEIDNDAATYSVCAGGQKFEIWDAGAKNEGGWERATVAFFHLVNANLATSPYKFYALYGGNDLSGIFLTEEQFAAARRAINQPSSWPWLPVNEPPHYGYPVAGSV